MPYDDINNFHLENHKYAFFDIFSKDHVICMISPFYFEDKYDSSEVESIEIFDMKNDKKIQLIGNFENKSLEPLSVRIYNNITNDKYTNIKVICTYKNIKYEKEFILENKMSNYDNKDLLIQTTLLKDDYKYIGIFKKYYEKHGVDKFYFYYNGDISKNKEIFDFESCNTKIIEWNYKYWLDANNVNKVAHHAQPSQIHHALYKYGKNMAEYILINDLDEYITIEDMTMKQMIEKDKRANYIFQNYWCDYDLKPDINILGKVNVSKRKQFPVRSKCIHNIDIINFIGIHLPGHPVAELNIIEKSKLLHFFKITHPHNYEKCGYELDLNNMEI